MDQDTTQDVNSQGLIPDTVIAPVNPLSIISGKINAILRYAGKWIQSYQYQTGTAGWMLNSNGTAEFYTVTIGTATIGAISSTNWSITLAGTATFDNIVGPHWSITHAGAATFTSVSGDGSGLTNVSADKEIATFTAGESITAGDAVAIGFYAPGDGPIAFDSKSYGNNQRVPTGGNIDVNITIGNHYYRALVVFITANTGTDNLTDVLFDGVSMTMVDEDDLGGLLCRSYVMFDPPIGTKTVRCTFSGDSSYVNITAHSYYNVDTTALASHDWTDSVGTTEPTTWLEMPYPIYYGTMYVTVVRSNSNTLPGSISNVFDNTLSYSGGSSPGYLAGDSGLVFPNYPKVTVGAGTNSRVVMSVGLTPKNTGIISIVKTSASTPTNDCNMNKYTSFVGFATESKTVGQSCKVQISGVVTNPNVAPNTGLAPAKPYYLKDTAGGIALTAGTNSRKVGLGVSDSQLLITNIW